MVKQIRVESTLLELNQSFKRPKLRQLLLLTQFPFPTNFIKWTAWFPHFLCDLNTPLVEGRVEARLLFSSGLPLWIFVNVQNQILLVDAESLNKIKFTLNSLSKESTNSSSSSSILTSSISHRRGANSWSTSVSKPRMLIFNAEISPSSSESINVNIYRNEFFFISWYIFSEDLLTFLRSSFFKFWVVSDFRFSRDFE